jgi:hypothetical protein
VSAEGLAAAIESLLKGSRLRTIGRAAGTGEVLMSGPADQVLVIHIQCPFRLVREGRIVLGSDDMNVSKTPWEDAFDEFRTVFDTRAADINRILEKYEMPLTALTLGEGGRLTIVWTDDLRLELFPNSSSTSREAWRVFEQVVGARHVIYPEDPAPETPET